MDPREDLVRHYRWLRQYGCNDSHSGNASVRDGETLWITPTGSCADLLEPSDLVPCGLEALATKGASLDTPLHQLVYRNNPEARCILHSHGPYTVAMTLDGRDFVPVDFEGWYYFKSVPVITLPYETYVAEAPLRVSDLLSRERIMVVRGHGVFACATTINLAYKWTCSLELSAKTAFLARQASGPMAR
jgi:L-fuculose-phosphate aldolase